jgi:hypothetical protein
VAEPPGVDDETPSTSGFGWWPPGTRTRNLRIESSWPGSRLTGQGSRQGPVNDRERTRNDGVAWERKRPAHPLSRAIAAGHGTCPRNFAKVGVAGSSPVVRSKKRSLTSGNGVALELRASLVGRSTNEKPTKQSEVGLL